MKTILITLFVFLISNLSLAAIGLQESTIRPPSFKSGEVNVVFVDFLSVEHSITYNVTNKVASAVSVIKFLQSEEGSPVIDLVSTPTEIQLDGKNITSSVVQTPGKETKVRLLNQALVAGEHTVTISTLISSLVKFEKGNVNSAFWYTDLTDRSYLEKYLPSNFEFDQAPMEFKVKFVGAASPQEIYTNGEINWLSTDEAQIKFPNYFTSSSVFFHTAPKGQLLELNYDYPSKSGKALPVRIYTSKNAGVSYLNSAKASIEKILNELETDYIAFPHPRLLVYLSDPGMDLGGMEYCGATITSMRALSHELFHSYVGRGLMPANGNSGWIDEAIASWRDDEYPNIQSMNGASVNMSNAGPYTRKTNRSAYDHGEDFMSYLDFKLKDGGGLRPFIKNYLETKIFTPYTIDTFVGEMEKHFATSIMPDFKAYTFKGRAIENEGQRFHKKFSESDLLKLL